MELGLFKRWIGPLSLAALIILVSVGVAASGGDKETKDKPFPYPLKTCLACSGEMGPRPVVLVDGGYEFKFCCPHCAEGFKKDPKAFHKKLEEAIIKEQLPTYPLKTCVVSGEKLGEMGEPVNYVYKGRLVRFCCSACIKNFEKDPEKYLAKIK